MISFIKLFLVLFIFLIYGKSLFFSFVTDDWFNIFDNAKVFSLNRLDLIFTSPQLNFGEPVYYRPFDTLYFLITFYIFGSTPFFYHLLSLLLLAIFSFFLFSFLKKKVNDNILALFFSLIFLSHPAITEVTGWISARNQIIEGILFLLTIAFFEKAYQKDSLLWFLSSIITATGALFFHDIGVMLFPVLLAYIFLFLEVPHWNKKKVCFLVLFSALFLVFFIIRSRLVPVEIFKYPLKTHLFTSFTIFSAYIKNIFFPVDLKIHYYDLNIKNHLDGEVFSSILITLSFFIVNIYCARKDKRVLFGFLFFLFTIFPASGLVKFIHKSLISDRYLFLPLIGVIISSSILERYLSKKRLLYGILCFIIIVFSSLSFNRLDIWRDDLANALERVREHPNNPVERSNLAAEYIKMNQLDLAEKELMVALNMSEKPIEPIYINMAILYNLLGNQKESEKFYLDYLSYDPQSYRVLYNLGTFYLSHGDIKRGKEILEKALKLAPAGSFEFADISNNLGIISLQERDKERAKQYFLQALKIKPYEEKYLKNFQIAKDNN